MRLPAEITDAHHHLWDPVSGTSGVGYIWLRDIGAVKPFGDPTPIQRDYLIEEFLAEAGEQRLAASVHLQADGAIDNPVAETRFVQRISDDSGFPIAIVGFVDLARADAESVITAHRQSANFRGVRQILSRLDDRPQLCFAPRHYLDDDRWRNQFTLLAGHGLSFDLQCYPEQMAQAAGLFARHPDIPVIIDHAGSPWDQSPQGMARWREGISLMAELPHVSIKLAGFGMFDRGWNQDSVRPMVETIVECFGWGRMMFASNFPVDKLMRRYSDILADMDTLSTAASDEQRVGFFSGNARRIYRF